MAKTPTYRKRNGYSQAIVTLTDSRTKKRRDYWLGEHGRPESREAYFRLLAEWEAAGRRFPDKPQDTPRNAHDGHGFEVREVVRAYWRTAKSYYQPNESGTLKVALRMLNKYYGRSPASEFGPSKLRLLRETMIRGDPESDPPRKSWSRVYTNQQTRRLRQMFRWAASHEMIPASVHETLATVEHLKRGRTHAREGEPVGPVPLELLQRVRPLLSRQVRALVDLQLHTGARSGELLCLRAVDLDTSDPSGVWVYRPKKHKTLHKGKTRTIYLGPAAQAAIQPFLANRPIDAFLFSPAETEAERREALRAKRKTPLCCGNRTGSNRLASPTVKPGDRYTSASYARAIQRACDEACPPPPHLAPRIDGRGKRETEGQWLARLSAAQLVELTAWRRTHRWHPHQLRHNAGTEVRRKFGLEAAQLMLGHASANITDAIYAERDNAKVIEVARKIG